MIELVSYSEAKAQGLTRYFTGKPCRRGHVASRRTCNGSCSVCSNEQVKRLFKTEKGLAALLARNKAASKTERGRAREARRAASPARKAGRVARRNRVAAIGPFASSAELDNLFASQSGVCVYCGLDPECMVSLERGTFGCHIDHKTPTCVGGDNSIINLQFMCQGCNDRKGSASDADRRSHLKYAIEASIT